VAISARPIDDRRGWIRTEVGFDRSRVINRRVDAVRSNQLSGNYEDDEGESGVFETSAHGSSCAHRVRNSADAAQAGPIGRIQNAAQLNSVAPRTAKKTARAADFSAR
jgi:hypothetical protein